MSLLLLLPLVAQETFYGTVRFQIDGSLAARLAIEKVRPAYPEEALKGGVEGTVVLSVVASPNGRIRQAAIDSSSGSELLDGAAKEAFRKWVFSKSSRFDSAVVRVTFTVSDKPAEGGLEFTLDKPSLPVAPPDTGSSQTDRVLHAAKITYRMKMTRELEFETKVDPVYPQDARADARGGTVALFGTVTKEGVVTDAKVVESSGHEDIDRAALEAFRGWTFKASGATGLEVSFTFAITD